MPPHQFEALFQSVLRPPFQVPVFKPVTDMAAREATQPAAVVTVTP